MKYQVLKVNPDLITEQVKNKTVTNFYVYLHKKITNDEIFYVGKGKRYRCTSYHNRSKHWVNTALKHGVKIELYKYNLTSSKACEIEKELISKLGLENLTNISLGGEGGLCGELNHFYNVRLYGKNNGNYNNKYENNPLSIPVLCFDLNGIFIKRYASAEQTRQDGYLPQCVVAVCNKKRKSHKDCIFIREKEYTSNMKFNYSSITRKKKVYSYTKEHIFIKSYNSINDTQKDGFNPKNVSQVINGSKKSHKNIIFTQYKI